MSRKKNHIYQFVLFSDTLIYGSERKVKSVTGKRFDHHRTLQLRNMMVDDVPGHEHTNAFQLRSNEKSFVVFAASREKKFDWIVAIQEAISAAKESAAGDGATLAPVWAADSESKVCTLCSSAFSMFNRRHHCRVCGRLVCGPCSKARQNKLRVCKECGEQQNFGDDVEQRQSHRSTAIADQRSALSETSERSAQTTTVAVAQYAFEPAEADDLKLAVGDVVYVDEIKEPWVKGRKAGTGDEGWFPFDYVTIEERVLDPGRPSQDADHASKTTGLAHLAKAGDKRSRVVQETLQTEVTYLNGLTKLLDVYVRPLLADFNSRALVLGTSLASSFPTTHRRSSYSFLSSKIWAL